MAKESTINLNLRLPPELHQQLVDSAGARHPRPVSLNTEIIERLRYTFATSFERPKVTLEDFQERLENMERLIWGGKPDE